MSRARNNSTRTSDYRDDRGSRPDKRSGNKRSRQHVRQSLASFDGDFEDNELDELGGQGSRMQGRSTSNRRSEYQAEED